MTGSDIITAINSLVDDSPDQAELIVLMNNAKNLLHAERDWEFLKAIDSTKTWAASDTYTTQKTLPTDFFAPHKLYLSGEMRPLPAIALLDRERYKDIYGRWYIDYANSAYSLCGKTGSSKTIYFSYIKSTTDWTASNLSSVSPSFPSTFHAIIAFYAAGIHLGGIDADDIASKMAPVHAGEFRALRKAMIAWDTRLKMHSMNYAARSPDIIPGTRSDVVGEGEIY